MFQSPRDHQIDTVAAMSMALTGGMISSTDQQQIETLLHGLDNQVNFLCPYTWQQRVRDELAFAVQKKGDPDNPTMTEALASDQ